MTDSFHNVTNLNDPINGYTECYKIKKKKKKIYFKQFVMFLTNINTNLYQEHHTLCPDKIRAWCPNTAQSWTNTNTSTETRKEMMCIHIIMTWKV